MLSQNNRKEKISKLFRRNQNNTLIILKNKMINSKKLKKLIWEITDISSAIRMEIHMKEKWKEELKMDGAITYINQAKNTQDASSMTK